MFSFLVRGGGRGSIGYETMSDNQKTMTFLDGPLQIHGIIELKINIAQEHTVSRFLDKHCMIK